jgi:hypothetical protein
MENLRKNLSSSAAGAVGAVSGAIPLAVCSGASCAACLGCVGIGAGVLALLIMKKYLRRSTDHGMAETGR